ncbi:MAG: pentapeptide repeat-containing protein [Pseudonocardiaceae bacterium]
MPILLTALAAVGALFFNTLQTSEALRATRDQIALSEQSQLTDRFTSAVEQLGTKDNTEVRLGGIYALEGIARDSARDHPTVMEILSAYVRMHAPIARCQSTGPRATDVQAILTVIGRRDTMRDRDRLALNNTCLVGYNLSGANLTNTDLTGANLTNTDLTDANLTEANLSFADFTRARGLQPRLRTPH